MERFEKCDKDRRDLYQENLQNYDYSVIKIVISYSQLLPLEMIDSFSQFHKEILFDNETNELSSLCCD